MDIWTAFSPRGVVRDKLAEIQRPPCGRANEVVANEGVAVPSRDGNTYEVRHKAARALVTGRFVSE